MYKKFLYLFLILIMILTGCTSEKTAEGNALTVKEAFKMVEASRDKALNLENGEFEYVMMSENLVELNKGLTERRLETTFIKKAGEYDYSTNSFREDKLMISYKCEDGEIYIKSPEGAWEEPEEGGYEFIEIEAFKKISFEQSKEMIESLAYSESEDGSTSYCFNYNIEKFEELVFEELYDDYKKNNQNLSDSEIKVAINKAIDKHYKLSELTTTYVIDKNGILIEVNTSKMTPSGDDVFDKIKLFNFS